MSAAAGEPRRAVARREGFALVTVVLVMVGLAVLATALVLAASQQATLVGTTHDILRARYAAEAAVSAAMRDWVAAERALDPVGDAVALLNPLELEPGARAGAASERLSADLFLLSGRGALTRPDAPPIERTALRLVRSLDADGIGRALDAAIIANRVDVASGAQVSGDARGDPALDAAAASLCEQWPPGGAAVRAPPDSVAAASGAGLFGSPVLAGDTDVSRFLEGIGFLSTAGLAAAARRIDAAAVTPAPVVLDGRCANSAPGNWGAESGPCAGHWPLLHAPGDLTVDGGQGQGLLLVDGDLRLEGGVRLRGILLVSGTVTLSEASVDGVLIAGRLDMRGGSVFLDRCAVAAALALVPPLRKSYPPARSWLPAFD